MDYRKSVSIFAFATLTVVLTQVANATCPLSCGSTYDGTSKTKSLATDTDLLWHDTGVPGDFTITAEEGSTGPTIVIGRADGTPRVLGDNSGLVYCQEDYKTGGAATVLGVCELVQVTPAAGFGGNGVDSGLLIAKVPAETTGFTGEQMISWVLKGPTTGKPDDAIVGLWKLVPLDPSSEAAFLASRGWLVSQIDFYDSVCKDENGNLLAMCWSNQGVPLKATAGDFPAVDFDEDGTIDLQEGDVLRYTRIQQYSMGTPVGPQVPDQAYLHFQHSGTWDGDLDTYPIVTAFILKGGGKPQTLKGGTTASGTALQGISVDVDPGSDDNPLVKSDLGVVTVLLPGSADLDVSTLDASTAKLEGLGPEGSSIEDSNGDGYDDLLWTFDQRSVVEHSQALQDASPGDIVWLKFEVDSAVATAHYVDVDQEGQNFVTLLQPLVIDIKGCSGSLNRGNTGIEPVWLLGGWDGPFDSLDVTAVDPTTVRLVDPNAPGYPGVPPVPGDQTNPGISDVSGVVQASDPPALNCGTPDGAADLILHFDSQAIAALPAVQAANVGDKVYLSVTGKLRNGADIRATQDFFQIVK